MKKASSNIPVFWMTSRLEHHGRAQGEVHVEGFVASIFRARIAAIEAAFQQPPRRRQKLRPKLPQAGKAKGAVLEAAIGEGQARADHACISRDINSSYRRLVAPGCVTVSGFSR